MATDNACGSNHLVLLCFISYGVGSWELDVLVLGSVLVDALLPFLHGALLEECRLGNFILVSSIGEVFSIAWEPGSR